MAYPKVSHKLIKKFRLELGPSASFNKDLRVANWRKNLKVHKSNKTNSLCAMTYRDALMISSPLLLNEETPVKCLHSLRCLCFVQFCQFAN
jgi:hypothetical protein